MRQNLPNVALFLVLAVALVGGGYYIEKTFFPPPPAKPVLPPRETVQALTGAFVVDTAPLADWRPTTRPPEPPRPVVPAAPAPAVVPPKPSAPPELIGLGTESSFLKVLLTTRGGAVQQVTLTRFDEANRLGREVKRPDGSPQPMRLIPGVSRPRDATTLVEPNGGTFPDLMPGKVADPAVLSDASYVLLHYLSEDDPLRPADADRSNDRYPSPELGDRTWTVAANDQTPDGGQRVVFETMLAAPYFLKLRKTYTLAPGDYHLGFTIDIEALPGRKPREGKFRYQVVGPRGLPVEGEWYAQTFRNVFVGSVNERGAARRTVEDALTIHNQAGGTAVPKGAGLFTYAAVGTQYFASALAIDDTQPAAVRADMWDYVRPSREPKPWDNLAQLFLADVTFRAVSYPLDLAAGESKTHKYLIYNGPMKVRLLEQVVGRPLIAGGKDPDPAAPAVVDRYLDNLTLRTLTDYQSPNVFGRIAASIYWSDVVIAFTNIMHGLLGFLHRYVPVWGVDIIMLTVMVRLLLFVPSRKQQASMALMQEKQRVMKPEMDALAEKFKDDPARLQQEKTKLMFRHGVNPLSAMGGCLLLFAQMPIFMGLYFCLQESVFFRLEPFLWFPNLAAPDMTVWWTENIPWVSLPENLGGTIYLGPFLNILPLIAVGLIFLQQYITMPPPTDEQQAMQQKMMKFMVIFMAVFFYKVPAGLCVYFICSTSWAIAERKLIKKPDVKFPPPDANPNGPSGSGPVAPTAPTGLMGRMRAKMEEMQRQADEQAKRQIRNTPGGRGTDANRKKRKP